MRWIFFLALPLFAAETLAGRLSGAKAGDYVVVEAGKTLTVVAIRANTDASLLFEEISAPLLEKEPTSWADWIQAKAPGHTSWSMTEIDLKEGQILECYSFSRSSWMSLSNRENLFASLLNLPLEKAPESSLRKIGPAPLDGEPDMRKLWKPQLVFEGQKIEKPSFHIFQTNWPDDGSEIAGKKVLLYFDQQNRSRLPFWIQVETTAITGNIRTIDAGENLPSIYRTMPRKPPEFAPLVKQDESWTLQIKCPKSYRPFELFAIDIGASGKQIIPVDFTCLEEKGDILTLEIEVEPLQGGHHYRWLLSPAAAHLSYIESPKSFSLEM